MSTKSTVELGLPTSSDVNGDVPNEPNTEGKDVREPREWVSRLNKFGDNSSFSAAVYEFKSKSWFKRILWLVIVLAAIAGFAYITSQSIRLLVNEPIATSITQSSNTALDFPAVTICSLSFLNTTKLDEGSATLTGFNIKEKLEDLFSLALATPPDTDGCNSIANEIVQQTNYQDGFSTLITDVARNDPSKLILQCSFLGQDCLQDLRPINTVSGVCFTFNGPNSGPVRKVSGTGARQGLRLQLLNGDQYFSLANNYGFSVVVHNRDDPPRPESEGVVVGTNSVLYVGMREVTSVDKTKFYSGQECIRESDYSDSKLSFTDYTSYSSSLCLNNCFYTYVADTCGCVEREFYTPLSSPYSTMRSCNAPDLCCEARAFDTFEDTCNCLPKCETIERTLTASSATHSFDGRVGINVYYETLMSEVRETTDSYTPWSLISDIGGNTGLFLGFTLLTVGEVVLLMLALCTDLCCSSCKNRARVFWAEREAERKARREARRQGYSNYSK